MPGRDPRPCGAELAARRWHVYAKTTLRGGEAYAYLARYAGRVAVSNGRLLAYDGQTVTIATKAGHPPVVMSGVELLLRWRWARRPVCR